MKWALGTAISLLIFVSFPALANIDIEPESAALLCVSPNSGDQITIDLNADSSGTCPEGFESWTLYYFEKVPGADPLPFEPSKQQEQDEASDAQPDQK